MPPTDPGLDERVCRKLGWEPRWRCEDCDQLNKMKDTRCRAFQRVDYCGWPREKNEDDTLYWPPVSTSWGWAGKVLEELSKRFFVEVTSWNQGGFGFWTVEIDSRELAGEKTGPLAIARAIDALPEPKP